jgi:hypothetical protein
MRYVKPDTVVRWQRERFRRFWARLSQRQRRGRGRPATAAEIRRLIEQMAAINPLWRAPRIHGELKMLGIAVSIFRFLRLLLSGHQAVAVENAAFGLQLAAFQRKRKRPVLTAFDRLYWVGLSRVWRGWRGPLLYVKPDTVVRWQRERFRRFWARLFVSIPLQVNRLKPDRIMAKHRCHSVAAWVES